VHRHACGLCSKYTPGQDKLEPPTTSNGEGCSHKLACIRSVVDHHTVPCFVKSRVDCDLTSNPKKVTEQWCVL
jgi:hypothetical protein